jgi:hypothetical protein
MHVGLCFRLGMLSGAAVIRGIGSFDPAGHHHLQGVNQEVTRAPFDPLVARKSVVRGRPPVRASGRYGATQAQAESFRSVA